MEAKKRKVNKVLGMVILICALAMVVLNLGSGKNMDDFILPFILLMCGVIILRGQSGKARELKLSPQRQKIVITTLSISLIAGIVTFVITWL